MTLRKFVSKHEDFENIYLRVFTEAGYDRLVDWYSEHDSHRETCPEFELAKYYSGTIVPDRYFPEEYMDLEVYVDFIYNGHAYLVVIVPDPEIEMVSGAPEPEAPEWKKKEEKFAFYDLLRRYFGEIDSMLDDYHEKEIALDHYLFSTPEMQKNHEYLDQLRVDFKDAEDNLYYDLKKFYFFIQRNRSRIRFE